MNETQSVSYTISILVLNRPGVMAKVTGLFARRGYDIESISAGKSREEGLIRLTIRVRGDRRSIEQIQKQLYKILDIVKVAPVDDVYCVEKELALIKVKAGNRTQAALFPLVEVFKARIVDTHVNGLIIEMTGLPAKIEAFIHLIPKQMITEIARSGVVAMNRCKPFRGRPGTYFFKEDRYVKNLL